MNRVFFVLVFLFLVVSHAFSESVLIVPFTVYDQNNTTFKLEKNPEDFLYEKLQLYDFGSLMKFSRGGSKYPAVYTSVDANKVCSVSESDYLFYGYIQKNDNSWYGNIKLYDFSKKKIVKEFFASDDILSYERFLSVLTDNIVSGLEEISGYSHSNRNDISYRNYELEAGGNLFYWTPLTDGWINTVTGVGGIQGDLRLYFPHKRVFIQTMEIDFSLDFRMSYSYGCGKESMYPLNFHILKMILPGFLYLDIDDKNTVYTGTGPFCEFDFLDIIERHSNRKLHYQNIFGLEWVLGYQFKINSGIEIFSEITVDFHFIDDFYVSMRPGIGAMFRLYDGERK